MTFDILDHKSYRKVALVRLNTSYLIIDNQIIKPYSSSEYDSYLRLMIICIIPMTFYTSNPIR